MKREWIRALVDRLVARDGGYRPLELCKLSRRLDGRDEQCWLRGEVGFLEDLFYGDPARVAEMLRVAAEWARRLELADEPDTAIDGRAGRVFRNSTDELIARTAWQRRQISDQADLFFDNSQATARNRLQRALVDGDPVRAEQHLAEMARMHPDGELLADAEHLVGALGWLKQQPEDPRSRVVRVEDELAARARRFLGADQADRFLAVLWRHLAGCFDPAQYDPASDATHVSTLLERAGDWSDVIDSIRAVPDYQDHPALLRRLAHAGLAVDRRDQGWQALAQLCWHHPGEAESFLERTTSKEIQRRIEQYWDLEPALPIELFPAWLATLSFALPDLARDESRGACALELVLAVRSQPTERKPRERLAGQEPELMAQWLATGRP